MRDKIIGIYKGHDRQLNEIIITLCRSPESKYVWKSEGKQSPRLDTQEDAHIWFNSHTPILKFMNTTEGAK